MIIEQKGWACDLCDEIFDKPNYIEVHEECPKCHSLSCISWYEEKGQFICENEIEEDDETREFAKYCHSVVPHQVLNICTCQEDEDEINMYYELYECTYIVCPHCVEVHKEEAKYLFSSVQNDEANAWNSHVEDHYEYIIDMLIKRVEDK